MSALTRWRLAWWRWRKDCAFRAEQRARAKARAARRKMDAALARLVDEQVATAKRTGRPLAEIF